VMWQSKSCRQRLYMGLVNFSHAARTNLRTDFIGAETCASADGHCFFPVGTFCFSSSKQFVSLSRTLWPEILGSR
jgi:hypothetical protein